MRPWWLPCRRRRRSRWESCWSLVCLRVQPPLSHSSSSPAFGSRNGVRHGFGSYWFPCSHRSDSRWDAQGEPGASTLCWHGGAPRPRGGDEGSACEYRSSFLPITKRRPLAVCLPICPPISSRRSSLSTAIRLTERPISPERWGHKSSRSLAEDTGALV